MLITPISRSVVSVGAWVRLASMAVTCGRPIPTTATSPSWSSLAPAAAMISVARTWTSGMTSGIALSGLVRRLITLYLHGFQFAHAFRAAHLLEIFPMVLGPEHIRLQVVGERLRFLGVVHIELQMFGIVVVAPEDPGGVPAE